MPPSLELSPIRVLRVIGGLDPEFGGTSEVAVNACIASQRCGVSNTLVFAAATGAEAGLRATEDRLRREGVLLRRFPVVPVLQAYARRWGISVQLCRWLMRHAGRYDVIHIHQTWGLAQIAAVLAAVGWRRPFVITPHESLTNYDVDREKRLVKSLLKRWYLSKAAIVEVASALEAVDSVPPQHSPKLRVVPHPLPDADALPPRTRQRRCAAPLVVGFLGRLHPKKNVDVVLRALSLADDVARLRVAGDGPDPLKRILLKCAADNQIAERVEWLGFVARAERSTFMNSIDVLVLVSEYECFGVAAAEAMAHGIPVIVSSTTGVASIAARYHCGIIVQPAETDVAAALRRFVVNRELADRMGVQGRVAASGELSMGSYGRATRLYYEQLIYTKS